MRRKKLAIISTHPIQYNAPMFMMLTARDKIDVKVFYTWSQTREIGEGRDYGAVIEWDIPLLECYEYEFVGNTSSLRDRNFLKLRTRDLIERIIKFNPDALLVYGWNFKSHLDVMRHFKSRIPVWFRGDSHLLDEKPGLRKLQRRILLRWVYRYVDKAFYVGTANKEYFRTHGLREEQLVYAPHAIDNDRFADNSEKKYEEKAIAWRKELGYSNNDIVFLFAGKFEHAKNLELLVKAFNDIVSNDAKGFKKLLMIGNGSLEHKLKVMASHNANIKFLPFQNQSVMPVVYRVGDVFCLPSRSETWGLSVNEALACGKPVIVSQRVGCSADLIKDERIGWRFSDLSHNGELTRILDCVNIQQIKDHQLKRNRQVFVTQWSYQSVCNAIEDNI